MLDLIFFFNRVWENSRTLSSIVMCFKWNSNNFTPFNSLNTPSSQSKSLKRINCKRIEWRGQQREERWLREVFFVLFPHSRVHSSLHFVAVESIRVWLRIWKVIVWMISSTKANCMNQFFECHGKVANWWVTCE